MASIKLNKDVTIVWRDGVNYRLTKNVTAKVPNKLLEYILTAPSYSGSILSFEKDYEPVAEKPKVGVPKVEETIEIEPEPDTKVYDIEVVEEEKEEETSQKQLDILKSYLAKQKEENAKTAKTAKKKGRPSKKK